MVIKNGFYDIEIYHIKELPAGHGTYLIRVNCEYREEKRKFSFKTHNMPAIDSARRTHGELKEKKLYAIIEDELNARLYEWLEEVNELKREL